MRSRVIDFLPDIYRNFLPEFFERPLAEERHATCANCVMCPPAVPDLPPEAYFSPSTKCCTFHPALPNYSVGGLLLDSSDAGREGRRRIQAKIARRVGVTPFAIMPPARVHLIQQHGKRAFGRAPSMVCPYLDQERGACTVWAQREAECGTWFCKHNHGEDGREFWAFLRNYLAGTQRVLVFHALRELGFDPDQISGGALPDTDLDARQVEGQPPPEAEYAAMWGPWLGREEELYTSAFEIVRSVDRATYAALGGLAHDLLLQQVAKRHDAIAHPRLPDPLIRNPSMRVDRAPDGSVLLTSYRNGEPTRLRRHIFDLLERFDGRRSTADVRASVRADTGFSVSDSFLIALYHHRILIDPTQAR